MTENAGISELDGSAVTAGAAVGLVPPRAAAIVPESGCACGGTGECTCDTAAPAAYVYAIGSVTARFPSLNIEKEFMQAWGKNPEQVLQISDADKFAVLSQGQNFYLAREMCWVFQSGDIDLYILKPRSYIELTDLVTCLAPTPNQVSFALVIGTLGPIAPPSLCNGTQLPIVTCNQVFSFTGQAFINSITNEVARDTALMAKVNDALNAQGTQGGQAGQGAQGGQGGQAGPGAAPSPGAPSIAGLNQQQQDYVSTAATNAFGVLTLLADNTGQTDEHRAINYLTFKSLALYTKEIEMELTGFALNSVTAQPDPLSGARRIQDVILLYASTSTTQVQRYFTRVDVSGQFPFMVNDLAIYYDHP
jgi:PatG C-terminal